MEANERAAILLPRSHGIGLVIVVNGINHKQIILLLNNPRLAILLEEVLRDLMAAETVLVAES